MACNKSWQQQRWSSSSASRTLSKVIFFFLLSSLFRGNWKQLCKHTQTNHSTDKWKYWRRITTTPAPSIVDTAERWKPFFCTRMHEVWAICSLHESERNIYVSKHISRLLSSLRQSGETTFSFLLIFLKCSFNWYYVIALLNCLLITRAWIS
jgi:hypothetical protein